MALKPPLYWRRRLQVLLYNLRQTDPGRRVHVSREGALYRIRRGDETIAIASIGRWGKYRKGVAAHTEKVAAKYGATALAAELAGATVLDAGANIGEFSLWCHGLGARVYAIEPDRTNLAALERNVAGLGITVSPYALWEEDREMSFFSSVARADSSLIRPDDVEGTDTIRAVRLDTYTAEQGIGDIAFIKADAEGAEPEVLRGAPQTLARTRHIAIDCGPERMGQDTVEECTAILEQAGFAVTRIGPGGHVLHGINRRSGRQGAA